MTAAAGGQPVDGRSKRPSDQVAAPAARPAKGTPAAARKTAPRSRPADPTLEGMGGAKAQAAYLFYRNMGPKRTIRKMAETYQKDEGTALARQRSFERWSTKYGWVEKVTAWDDEQAEKENERKRKQRERMDDDQGDAMGALWFSMLDRTNEMVRLDRLDQAAFDATLRDWLGQDPLTRGDPPRAPKPRLGAYALAQLMRTGLEYERIARQAATEIVAFDRGGDAGLMPPVFEVHLSGQRPADPVDPYEAEDAARAGLPAAARAAAAAALPPALAHLTTKRPPEPPDPDEDGAEEADDGWDDDEE